MQSSLALSQTGHNLDFTTDPQSCPQASNHESHMHTPPHQYHTCSLSPADTFPTQHEQSIKSSSANPVSTDYDPFESPFLGGNRYSFASSSQANFWTAHGSDDAIHELRPSRQPDIQQTDPILSTTLSEDAVASFPIWPSPWESGLVWNRANPSGSTASVDAVNLLAAANIQKSYNTPPRKGGSRKRNSPSSSPARHHNAKRRKQSPTTTTEDEILHNDLLGSEDEDNCHAPENSGKLTFACPLFRRFPTQFVDCMSCKLTRIQDVKRHIFEWHCQPFYCPTCRMEFSSLGSRDEHVRKRSCVLVDASSDHFEGKIPAQVREPLANCFRKKLDPEEKWKLACKLMFPGEQPPQSPYFRGMILETLGMFRDFCTQRIVPSMAQHLKQRDLKRLMTMVDEFQNHIDDETRQPKRVAGDDPGSSGTHTENPQKNGKSDGPPEEIERANEFCFRGAQSYFDSSTTNISGAPVVGPNPGFDSLISLDGTVLYDQDGISWNSTNLFGQNFNGNSTCELSF
ncbi:hypothetical protein NQ176_g8689 [Zarea fungicola]|uniref:Uncharacterized protein n=1 Tax=Zarea fungicola TaxID=93591 RepID=A0ACC1MRV6_9HYPO|nr:hypothetical protein NQ176_g8689 [Lecanicillium fungicola]